MVEIASFEPPKKARSVIFFQKSQLLFGSIGFIINESDGFIKNDMRVLVKLPTELRPVEHFLLSRPLTSHKNFKRN